jgi:hypothetical protein
VAKFLYTAKGSVAEVGQGTRDKGQGRREKEEGRRKKEEAMRDEGCGEG